MLCISYCYYIMAIKNRNICQYNLNIIKMYCLEIIANLNTNSNITYGLKSTFILKKYFL